MSRFSFLYSILFRLVVLQKLNSLRNLLDKDRRRREELRLPIPDFGDKKKEEADEGEKEHENERKLSKERRRSSLHSTRDSEQKSGTRRLPPQRTQFTR